MTREERLKSCSICLNKDFNPKSGIVCKLTSEPATFENSCPDFKEDERQAGIEVERQINLKRTNDKPVRQGRNALFAIGALYVIAGIAEAFIIDGHELLYGLIDWGIAAVFFGLALWSYKKPSLSMILGLVFYVAIIALLGVVDPSTIISGIIWKILIIFYLIYGIQNAKNAEVKQSEQGGDLLDQI